MLQKGFFLTKPFNPKYIELELIHTENTPGAFSYTVPDSYNFIKCEIAGAAGSDGSGAGSPGASSGIGRGSGAIIQTTEQKLINHTITGVVGQIGSVITGGTGYHNGSNGTDNGSGSYGGGGGGSTSVEYNSTTYEACGGAGETRIAGPLGLFGGQGGNGGGQYGGIGGNTQNQRSASDPNKTGLNTNGGYVKIFAGYDPYL